VRRQNAIVFQNHCTSFPVLSDPSWISRITAVFACKCPARRWQTKNSDRSIFFAFDLVECRAVREVHRETTSPKTTGNRSTVWHCLVIRAPRRPSDEPRQRTATQHKYSAVYTISPAIHQQGFANHAVHKPIFEACGVSGFTRSS